MQAMLQNDWSLLSNLQLGWHAVQLRGIISVAYLMDALDPQWKDDPGMTNSSPRISLQAIGPKVS
jgi:hypothetical protein